MKIIVEDFGKIAHAEVEVGDLTIFVGENNSGKTFLMQLIYGVVNNITSISSFSEELDDYVLGNEYDFRDNKFPFNISTQEIENLVNVYLNGNKESIVREIFKKDIKIGKLRVEFARKNKTVQFRTVYSKDNEIELLAYLISGESENWIVTINTGDTISRELDVAGAYSAVISTLALGYVHCEVYPASLFLPASRAGLLLLSPFFYEKEMSRIRNMVVHGNNTKISEYNENAYGLTAPVYDYLSFLQSYQKNEENSRRNADMINFISSEMVNGTIYKDFNAIMYKPNGSEEAYPATHSSSSINEISPVALMLDSYRRYKYVFYDEVETCQHPKMQIQTARLITRMVNRGFKMIVSTHSLAMAAALNNHIMLSSSPVKNETVKKLGYAEDDILKTSNVHVYEMVNKNGRTVVKKMKELDFSEIGVFYNEGKGYEFSTFSAQSSVIIDKANTILNDIAMSQAVPHETEDEKNA